MPQRLIYPKDVRDEGPKHRYNGFATSLKAQAFACLELYVTFQLQNAILFMLTCKPVCWPFKDGLKRIEQGSHSCTYEDDFSDGQNIGSTDCQHSFHFNCISQWLMQKNSCPLRKRIALAI
ncbi:putative polygalacturonase-like [Capsicum annuum]|uniref:RING-type E3 ubiquitin transferase n=1 Tax=Capsicum annuum TaxID=4072 RepID=A0A2G3A847_CAPAN|nr:putative polygalacturonase-like [Capsicum annuum]KAF3652770.1 putative polygalacturonase-like [Capsicum annuum]PHT90371.1 hypothetical protein T459_05484 [Capsicum annuum]